MNIKKYAQDTLNHYVDTHLEDINLFPRFKGLMFSSRGIPSLILESEDSTVILDMDETLVHVMKLSPSVLELIKSDSGVLTSKGEFRKSNEARAYADAHLDEFKDAIEGYKYKDSLDIRPHKVFGYAIIVFRPLMKEFLNTLEGMIGSKDLKDVIIYTANMSWWIEELVSSVNKHTGKNLKAFNGEELSSDSMIIDDNEHLAKIKLFRAKVTDNNGMASTPRQWIPIPQFRGDLKDIELKKIIKKIKSLV